MINIIGLTSIYTYSWSKWSNKSNNEQPIGKTKINKLINQSINKQHWSIVKTNNWKSPCYILSYQNVDFSHFFLFGDFSPNCYIISTDLDP
jgi:hypothetical protein